MSPSTTRFAALPATVARLILVGAGLATAALVAIALFTATTELAPDDPSRSSDLETYALVVARLRQGEPYHQALHAELLANDYGTRSVLNWRPPAHLSALSWFPSDAAAGWALGALAIVAILAAYKLVRRRGSIVDGLAVMLFLIASLLASALPSGVLLAEHAAAVCMLLSLAAYAFERRELGFLLAFGALLCRETAGVYVVVCLSFAWRDRRWGEVIAWGVALSAFALYFAWHAHMVIGLLGAADRAQTQGWLQFGGIFFILRASTYNGLFLLLPGWVTALLLPAALLGAVGARVDYMARVAPTLLGYLVLFAIFGRPDNLYWGALYTPLLAFGAIWTGPALRDLGRAARAFQRISGSTYPVRNRDKTRT